jgi:hypothetical protein
MEKSSKPTIRIKSRLPSGNRDVVNYANGNVDIPSELIEECSMRFEKVMHPSISFKYKVITRLPLQYSIVPSSIRSRFLRMSEVDGDLSQHLANEIARKALVDAFNTLGFPLRKRDPPAFHITHDIDSERGLRRARALKDVENELGLTSTWFLPSDEYDINEEIAVDLTVGARIGSHDTRHDGKLIHIRRHKELVDRLKESKTELEKIFDKEIICFRAPLLQFSGRIAAGLKEAGYGYDFSVPSWEPMHPTNFGGFGVESVQPFEVNGIVETPLTLFQDHQVLNVQGMSTIEAVKFWTEQARLVHSFGGDIVLSVHPDYQFGNNPAAYKKLLISLSEVAKPT